LRSLLSYLYIAPAVIVITIGFGLVSLALSLFGAPENRLHEIARIWARWLLRLSFVDVEIEGLEKLDPSRNYVLVANHASFMDTPVIIASLPLQFRFFAKLGLFQIPMIGTHLGRAGHFPVDRGNARASLKSMSDAARAIALRNVSVLLFPEGGRSETGHLQDFKEGAAYIAIKSGVPLLPIGIVGTRQVLPMHSLGVRPGKVLLRIGDVIETKDLTLAARHELSERSRQQVAALLHVESHEP
jgi:1-acyl-sn-glycerol-3-phosphate acyltransferase